MFSLLWPSSSLPPSLSFISLPYTSFFNIKRCTFLRCSQLLYCGTVGWRNILNTKFKTQIFLPWKFLLFRMILFSISLSSQHWSHPQDVHWWVSEAWRTFTVEAGPGYATDWLRNGLVVPVFMYFHSLYWRRCGHLSYNPSSLFLSALTMPSRTESQKHHISRKW